MPAQFAPLNPLPLNLSNDPSFPAMVNTIPRRQEGSKVLTCSIDWQSTYNQFMGRVAVPPPFASLPVAINLLRPFQSGQFTTVQAIFVDNSTCPYTVTLTEDETGQTVRVPAFTQGMYPIFCLTAPAFVATMESYLTPNGGFLLPPGSTQITFLNTPQRYFQSMMPGVPQAYTLSPTISVVAPTATILTDPSGFGIGMRQFPVSGPVTPLRRLKTFSFSMVPNAAFTVATTVGLTLNLTAGSQTQVMLALIWIQPVGSVTAPAGITNHYTFGDGLPDLGAGDWNVLVNVLPPASTWAARFNLTFDVFTVY